MIDMAVLDGITLTSNVTVTEMGAVKIAPVASMPSRI
jgi:hypothetical protein